MKSSYVLVTVLTGLVGGVAATFTAVVDSPPKHLTCSGTRVVAYGWTSKRQSLAELAAISKWQKQVKSELPGYDQWHQAYKRRMNCQLFEDSSHFQCEVSATPCHFKKA